METTTVQNTEDKTKLFFSEHGNHIISYGKDRRVVQDGVATVLDSKLLRFTPTTNHGYGKYATADPEEIEFLEKHPGIMSEQQFLERTRTPEQKLAAATNEYGRKLEEQNRLIQELQAKLKPQARTA